MTELEAVERLQGMIDTCMTMPHTYYPRGGAAAADPRWAWVYWSCWQVRVGLAYHLPELASIRVLRVYRLFALLGGRGGADFDLEVGHGGRSERVKVVAEGIGINRCRITLYRWVNGQRRRIGAGVVGVQVRMPEGLYLVWNLETMPATAG